MSVCEGFKIKMSQLSEGNGTAEDTNQNFTSPPEVAEQAVKQPEIVMAIPPPG